ncbi:MAG: GNAT family N-acetyltransferase [Alphaproteobacteria bacterium]|nr:GNAT family N-acetyltransferase [Alphaproteobacteria bacterium SS10]
MSDAADIASLHAASWRDVYTALIPGGLPSGVEGNRTDFWAGHLSALQDGCIVLAAFDGTELLGFAASEPCPDDPAAACLAALHVDPTSRGRRVGQALMAALANKLIAAGTARLWCHVLETNHAARRFYARLGAVEGAAEQVHLMDGLYTRDLRLAFPPLDNLMMLAGKG